MVASLQRGPGHCYCSPRYMVVTSVPAPRWKNLWGQPCSTLTAPLHRYRPTGGGERASWFCQGHPWLPRAHFTPSRDGATPGEEINQPEGHQPWVVFQMGPTREQSAKRGHGGKSRPQITPGDPTQPLGSPAASPALSSSVPAPLSLLGDDRGDRKARSEANQEPTEAAKTRRGRSEKA